MSQPHWSGKYPDFIVIKTAPDIVDISGVTGSWLDRREAPLLEIAIELTGCKIEPTDEFEVAEDGSGVAQIWMMTKAFD